MKRLHTRPNARRGNILVLSAFLMIFMLALVAFSVDIGYMAVAKTELQRSADASAMAATWQLINDEGLQGDQYMTEAQSNAKTCATQYASWNKVCNEAPTLDTCPSASDGDVTVGYLANITDPNATFDTSDPTLFNAVRVQVQRTSARNGAVPFFFGPVLGVNGKPSTAEATAAFYRSFSGFQVPSDGSNIMMLPFALDEETWDDLCDGNGCDNWTWDPVDGACYAGADGILEVNLYPKGNGSPGNRGTVDIGRANNSTSDIARQILEGISPADMAALEQSNRKLEFDSCGKTKLNGDTGISAGVKDELASIIGDPRMIPIFREVIGPGNNAEYTIVHWAGVRIMKVKFSGGPSSKCVMIQPCNVMAEGAIPSSDGGSSFIYSKPTLVR